MLVQGREGTRLVLVRAGQPELEVWRGNRWVSEITTGKLESFNYASSSGQQLSAWILYPPGHVTGRRIPFVTFVYPGTIYGAREPGAFDILTPNFVHAQLLAAMGYGVLLPSMPASDKPLQTDAIAELSSGVVPAIDTLRRARDRGSEAHRRHGPERRRLGDARSHCHDRSIQKRDCQRFLLEPGEPVRNLLRSGPLWGAGTPERAQLLRTLQFERGDYAAGAPPWEKPEGYRVNSPIWRVAQMSTPLMLVHGDKDFIPIQQAEEMFTALYRRDKHAQLVRYAGEGHTISDRVNVLDFWNRVRSWLAATLYTGQLSRVEK